MLANVAERTGPARDVLESLIDQAMAARAASDGEHRASFDSLCGALQGLRQESLRSAVRRLARQARPGDPAGAAKLMDRAYSVRSAIVHGGARVDLDLLADLRPLVQDVVRFQTLRAAGRGLRRSGAQDCRRSRTCWPGVIPVIFGQSLSLRCRHPRHRRRWGDGPDRLTTA